jgi:pimeloyl-ACP methyl ester carboxylesterase
VVLVSGLGGVWFDWGAVVDRLPVDLSVIGVDPSRCPDRPSLPRRVGLLTEVATGLPRPVVWVAHSMAAFAVEALGRRGSAPFDGLVMVDPSVGEEPTVLQAPIGLLGARLHRHPGWAQILVGHFGPLGRRLVVRALTGRRDRARQAVVQRTYGDPTVVATILTEYRAFDTQAAVLERLRRLHRWPPTPAVVLLAGRRRLPFPDLGWIVRRVPRSGHLMMLDRPEVIVGSILAVIDEICPAGNIRATGEL